MTFQTIGYLWAAVVAAGLVVALHLLARRRPRPAPLPTARFIPERPVRAPAFHRRPSDLLLLALRVSAILLLGAAFARPRLPEPRTPIAQVVIGDSFPSFGSAFAAALRLAGPLRETADSVALSIAMPLTRDRWDAGTAGWRAAWPGRVGLVPAATPEAERALVVWPELPGGNAIRGLVLGDMVAIGAWGSGPLPDGQPVAWFHDGAVAAIELSTPRGCERHVAIGTPPDDSHLRSAYRRIAVRLKTAPCGRLLADTTPLDSAQIALLEGDGGLAATSALPRDRRPARPPTLLLLLAVAFLGAEQLIRRRSA